MQLFNFHDISMNVCGCDISYLVLAVVGPDVIEARGREERRGMSEEFTAAAYWEKHLHTHTQTLVSYEMIKLQCNIWLRIVEQKHAYILIKYLWEIWTHRTCTSPDTPPLNTHGSESTPRRSAPEDFPHPTTNNTQMSVWWQHVVRANKIRGWLSAQIENDPAVKSSFKYSWWHKKFRVFTALQLLKRCWLKLTSSFSVFMLALWIFEAWLVIRSSLLPYLLSSTELALGNNGWMLVCCVKYPDRFLP